MMDTLAPARSAGENCVRRREAPGELAEDSEAPKGSERLYVNAARIRGKFNVPYPGRSAMCLGDETEEIERSSDRIAEVSTSSQCP